MNTEKRLSLICRLQALAQNGLTYTEGEYDLERYQELREISVELLQEYSKTDSLEKVNSLFASEEGYQTPKIDVRGLVIQDNKILMVQEKSDEKWALPGGFADVESSPSEAIIAEVEQEAGLIVKTKQLLAVLDSRKYQTKISPYHFYKMFFVCEVIGGELKTGMETLDVKFCIQKEIENLSISEGRNSPLVLQKIWELLESKSEKTYFD